MRPFLFLAAVVVSAVLVAPAATGAPRPKTVAGYCSPSGDVCLSVVRRQGVLRLEIWTAARYFTRYTLCVRPPGAGVARCGSFPLFRNGASGSGSVRLRPTFPAGGSGVYRVTWRSRADRTPLGPTLRFRL